MFIIILDPSFTILASNVVIFSYSILFYTQSACLSTCFLFVYVSLCMFAFCLSLSLIYEQFVFVLSLLYSFSNNPSHFGLKLYKTAQHRKLYKTTQLPYFPMRVIFTIESSNHVFIIPKNCYFALQTFYYIFQNGEWEWSIKNGNIISEICFSDFSYRPAMFWCAQYWVSQG